MKCNREIITMLFLWTASLGLFAQGSKSCDSLLRLAHARLGSLYSPSATEGYSFRVTINAAYRNEAVTKFNPQQFHMMASGKTFVFESEQLDSYQNDSVRVSVIKGQNRVYISASESGKVASYMEQFNAIQKQFAAFVSVDQCTMNEGRIHIRAMVKQDTLGLENVKAMSYIIDKKTNDIHQILVEYAEDSEIQNYSIVYSDIVKPYTLSKDVTDRYLQMAHRADAGDKKFEQYLLIDNRKKSGNE